MVMTIVFAFISCNNKLENTKNIANVKITDTLVFANALEFNLTDIKDDKFLGYDRYSKGIICYNDKGEIVFRFNKTGGAEFEYFNVADVKFYTDSTIVILAGNKVKEYNFKGDYKKTIYYDDIPSEYYRKSLNVRTVNGDTIVLYSLSRGEFTGTPDFYTDTSRTYVTGVNVNKHKTYNLVRFEKNSIYTKGDEYYQQTMPIFTLNETGDSVFAIFPYETKLYTYSVEEEKLVSAVEFKAPEFKKPKGTKFGQQADSFKLFQINSNLLKVFTADDTIYVFYDKGFDEAFETFTELNKVNGILYLDILTKKGKLISEVKLPEDVSSIAIIKSSKEIYFFKYQTEKESNTDNYYLLKGEIVFANE